jgi:transposase
LAEGGKHTIREIANQLNMPKSTVYDITQRGTPNSKPKMGHPAILTAQDKRRIDLYIKRSKETRQQPPEGIIKALHLSVKHDTLVKAIHELGYRRCIARRRPLLKAIDEKRRLQFARTHKHWTVEDWKRVIFTDEMSIKIGMARLDIMWVWRKSGEEFHRDCVELKKRSTGGKMFWGAFRWGKIGPGLFFQLNPGQKINSTIYRDQILLGPLKQFRDESLIDIADPIVMEDGAPVHNGVCKGVREKLKWTVYEHPPNSPDLNPIENIWAYMKREFAAKYKYVSSQADMQRIIIDMWNNFDDSMWNKLIESMPARMQAVIKAKGGPTRY